LREQRARGAEEARLGELGARGACQRAGGLEAEHGDVWLCGVGA